MKKKYFIIIVALFVILSGCNNISKSKYDNLNEKYNAVVAHRDELADEIRDLEAENHKLEVELEQVKQLNEVSDEKGMVKVVLSGGFTVTVHSLIPNYAIHPERPLCAVVSHFQRSPFVIYLGDELISQVEEGKTYVFEIERKVVDMYQDQYQKGVVTEAFIPLYNLRITSIRLPNDDEIGLEEATITMTLAD